MSLGIRSILIGVLLVAISISIGTWLFQSNSVRVVDGDTLKIGDQSYRLTAIDAPELGQTCRDSAGRDYACGRAVADHLRELIGTRLVTCRELGRDRFQRIVAKCEMETDGGPVDLSAYMIRAGWAVTDDRYGGKALASDQTAAQRAKRGLWSGAFDHPADYRRRHQSSDSSH